MEKEKLDKIIENQLSIVPKDISDLVVSTDFSTKINWVTGKYNLSKNQSAMLLQETLFVLIGLAKLSDYTTNVSAELALPNDQAKVIAQEVGTQVFSGVKDSLREIGLVLEMAEKERGGTNTPPVSQTPKPVSGVLIQQEAKKEVEKAPQINRAVLLNEIEHPALIEAHAQNQVGHGGTIVDEKLGGMVKIPRQEAHVDMTKSYSGTDPYREPLS